MCERILFNLKDSATIYSKIFFELYEIRRLYIESKYFSVYIFREYFEFFITKKK